MSSGNMFTDNSSFMRKEYGMGKKEWQQIKTLATAYCVSPLSALLSAISEVVSRWSSGAELSMMLINESDETMNGDFVDRILTAEAVTITFQPVQEWRWIELCRHIDVQLNDSKNHSSATKLTTLQHTALIGMRYTDTVEELISHPHAADRATYATQTKLQDYLICHMSEQEHGIVVTWEVHEVLFSQRMTATMFEAYICLLNGLAEGSWEQQLPDTLPEAQRQIRDQVNSTFVQVEAKLIHADFFMKARENPEREALLWDDNGINRCMTYGELADKALRMAALLLQRGVKQGDAVAVTLPRGPNQIIAVLAVLAAGAAYVPIGVSQPEQRRDRIYRIGEIRYVIMDKAELSMNPSPTTRTIIFSGEADSFTPLPHPVPNDSAALAYVIFTSGSTGEPKGVQITHQAAHNTISDMNTRFIVSESDTVLAVSALDFDLSVYDIFGLLSVGGKVVLLHEHSRREAIVWLDLIRRMKVTVWNSVPALFEMLMIGSGEMGLLPSLRLVLVSGDWVGLDLYERLRRKSKDCRLIALGGATEASIWSNYYEVKGVNSEWTSIPYGTPLHNQCYRVVDRLGRDCPDMVSGELWIGGIGVARGYLGNDELTSKHFIHDGGKRWYRTGDWGRYWPDGNIEFLGRSDQQVKLRGYRIELGEVEAALRQYGGVGQVVAVIASNAGTKQLMTAVVADSTTVQTNDVPHVSVAPESIDNVRYKENSREIQAKMAESLIAEIFNLSQLSVKKESGLTLAWNPRVTEAYESLRQMWLLWLCKRNVIVDDNGSLRAGPRMEEVLQYTEALTLSAATRHGTLETDSAISSIEQRLFQRLDDYRSIIGGDMSAMVLLEDDLLAPESLSTLDSGTISGIEKIAARIKTMFASTGKPVETALLGGRSGLIALKLLEMLDPEEIRFTLLDTAPSMVEAAKNRLSALPHVVNCKQLPDSRVPNPLQSCFDVVLAINSLHRYHDPYHGVALASLLLRRGGKLFALEHSELTPLAAVTSAVLDRGFVDFDHDRSQAYSPMLSAQQWANLCIKAGLHPVSCSSVDNSFTEMIEADCPLSRPELNPEHILSWATAQLPAHMVPEKVEILPWLPLSANGKVDRKAVASVFESTVHATVGELPHEGLEQEVSSMWTQLLGLASIGRKQGFFELGGDSLLATRFLTAVKERYGIDLSLRHMFEAPALHQIAASIEQKRVEKNEELVFMEEGEI
ncbi:amino acid adenylation domain-containing protein [Paenibacillus sp. 481]|uniref:amino acid adenylation domain-containing protein n=1 Tax=Paenibacillus sp. 481 TaxID=2835869 RepID=UPI001E3DC947|nr:amino acid adenylation domain-containing protein [Paenibacillus sp. 481]UHA73193.1 amino acid adenylation domain-containing protein [Paenibacillus sp. 481]